MKAFICDRCKEVIEPSHPDWIHMVRWGSRIDPTKHYHGGCVYEEVRERNSKSTKMCKTAWMERKEII